MKKIPIGRIAARALAALISAGMAVSLIPTASAAEPAATAATQPAAASPVETYAAQDDLRDQVNFNRQWKFIRQDVKGAQAAGFDDSGWTDIALPHDFDMPYEVGGNNGGQNWYVGYGWYRKSFDVPAEWLANGRQVEIEFEGVFQVADVYVNGQKIGTHEGGYSGFAYDLTKALKAGENEIAVRVNNIWQQDLTPRAGDHQFSGGIYRDVYLRLTSPVHVARYGTFVTAPALTNPAFDKSAENIDFRQYPSDDALAANLEAKRSNLSVATDVTNATAKDQYVQVKQELVGADGKTVATKAGKDAFYSEVTKVAAGKSATIAALSGGLNDTAAMYDGLKLWDTENPNLYTVKTTVYAGDNEKLDTATPVDSYETSFGFRTAQWKNDGFYLNGKKTLLNGANVHQDHGGWANAVTDAGFERDVKMVKEAGMNFIRGSHYPHDVAFAEACDRLGILFWSENVFWGMGGQAGKNDDPSGQASDWLRDAYPQNAGDQDAFDQSVLDAMREMILENRNSPSVISWSAGNEVFFTSNATQNRAKALVNKERNLAHQLDPTRKTGMGGAQRQGYDQLSVADIAGYNGDGGRICGGGECPNTWMPNMVAEYGSPVIDRPGAVVNDKAQYKPGTSVYGELDKDNDGQYTLTKNSAGLALWAGFDHGTVGGKDLAKMGMIDYFRLPKNLWYWYRETQGDGSKPEVSKSGTATHMDVTTSADSPKTLTNDGKTDAQVIVTMKDADGNWVNDNRVVTLKVTDGPGVLAGGKTYTFTKDVSMKDGKAAIEFRSYYSGTTTLTASAEGLPDATLTITTKDVTGGHEGTEPANFYEAGQWSTAGLKIPEPMAYGDTNKALNRPASPSSSEAGHEGALGADGDEDTQWIAGKAGSGESFVLSTEFAQYVYKIRLGFGKATPYPYTLYVANDRNEWEKVAEYTKDTVASRPAEENVGGLYAGAVKVEFTDVPDDAHAFLNELEVYGNDQAQAPQYGEDGAYAADFVSGGRQVTIGGVDYGKGLAVASGASADVAANAAYSRVLGVAGLDSSVTSGSATFTVKADGVIVWERKLAAGDKAAFDVSVSTAKKITFAVSGAAANVTGNWGDVRLLGALRSITASGSTLGVQFAGLDAQLHSGTPYRAAVRLANSGSKAVNAKVQLTVRKTSDDSVVSSGYTTATIAPGAVQTADVTVPVNSANGLYGTVSVVDAADGATALSRTAYIGVADASSQSEETVNVAADTTLQAWKTEKTQNFSGKTYVGAMLPAGYDSLGEGFKSTNTGDGTDAKMGLLRFDLTKYQGNAPKSAKLELTYIGYKGDFAATDTDTIKAVAIDESKCTGSGSCTVENATWANRPDFDATADGTLVAQSEAFALGSYKLAGTDASMQVTGTKVSLDVTDIVAAAIADGKTAVTFAINETKHADVRFVSSEGANGGMTHASKDMTPKLAVTVERETTPAVALAGIAVTAPTKTDYKKGDVFDAAGMTVKAIYSDGTEKTLTADQYATDFSPALVDGGHFAKAGTYVLTVREKLSAASPKTATLSFVVPDEGEDYVYVTGIAIDKLPTKTKYQFGKDEKFSADGLVVVATKSDGSKQTLAASDYTLEGTDFDTNSVGAHTITVRHGDFTATFTVYVVNDTTGGDDGDTSKDDLLWYNQPASKTGLRQLTGGHGFSWCFLANCDTDQVWQQTTLPIGNGKIGGTVYGEVGKEHVVFNEETLWTGGPGSSANYNGGNEESRGKNGQTLRNLNKKLQQGGTLSQGEVNGLVGGTDATAHGNYVSWGDLYIDYNFGDDGFGDDAAVADYKRDLNLSKGKADVTFKKDGVTYTREYFASNPDNVMVVRLKASEDGKLNLNVAMPTYKNVTKDGEKTVVKGDTLTTSGALKNNGLRYDSQIKAVLEDGSVAAGDDKASLQISGASVVTLYIAAATDYKQDYPKYRTGETADELAARVAKTVKDAANKGYGKVKDAHVKDHEALYDRVKLNLGQTVQDEPTDQLLAKYTDGSATDAQKREIETLLYQYGRYLTIGSSRENSQLPSNLQGIWAARGADNAYQSGNNPWNSDFHLNVNLQMNYWPTYTGNLGESAEPLIGFAKGLVEPGRVTAKVYAGAETKAGTPIGEGNGFMVHTENTPFGWTTPGAAFSWGWSPAVMPWLLQNVYEKYEYTGDKEALEKDIYPLLKEESNFYVNSMLHEAYLKAADGKTRLTTGVAYSPEQGPQGTDGNTYESSLVWQMLNDVIEAADTLGKDKDLVGDLTDCSTANWAKDDSGAFTDADANRSWTCAKSLLKPIEIGDDGQIKEWYNEGKLGHYEDGTAIPSYQQNHRHMSHLLGLYPGDLITIDNPEYMEAAKVSMNDRGDVATGWGRAQRINAWARTGDGNRAYKILGELIAEGMYANLFDAHPPFQIDGNFGYTAGVAEMLMQSNSTFAAKDGTTYANYTNILPALPDAWASAGSVDGLIARGNFEVAVSWKDGATTSVKLTSNKGGQAAVKLTRGDADAVVVRDAAGKLVKSHVVANAAGAKLIVFDTTAGGVYTLAAGTVAAPAAPASLKAEAAGTTSVRLTWKAPASEAGLAAYRVSVDGKQVAEVAVGAGSGSGAGSGADVAYTVDGLKADTEYDFAVVAVDTLGQVSEPATAKAKTEAETPEPTPVDKTKLTALIDAAGKLAEADYTADSWAALKAALSAAVEVRDDASATQDAVDAAAAALDKAIKGLKPAEKPEPTPVDKAALNALITQAQGLAEADYTADSWAALKSALSAAVKVRDDASATQAEVDAAAAVLDAAIKGLKPAEQPGPGPEPGKPEQVTAGKTTVKAGKTATVAEPERVAGATGREVTKRGSLGTVEFRLDALEYRAGTKTGADSFIVRYTLKDGTIVDVTYPVAVVAADGSGSGSGDGGSAVRPGADAGSGKPQTPGQLGLSKTGASVAGVAMAAVLLLAAGVAVTLRRRRA
ncbi:glycosyl hydrolase family 95 catalytic domain-containing protein [Bifidobacterium leontopitheci]|uniref:Glycosyl hydrolase family 65, N-terminal domain-containing protein n=1 Tax=Bifidobacterium leontopitheci TaxID=2650774 RepID=A0A6I1GFP8_9BIFI|nr:glycoside hydrolase N-terminal domain-containing protein [Bifidobacterium leontopitheci]KAB7790375.1 Glycosyl hydrolase family 65, N-terminal domain-containing protein [Bifidobacterium leontopitheci]